MIPKGSHGAARVIRDAETPVAVGPARTHASSAVVPAHVAVGVPARRHTVRRRALLGLLLVGAVLVAGWRGREALLARVGEAIVAEDRPSASDVVVVSIADVRAGALEAARLYQAGLARRVLVSRWREESVDATVRALGIRDPQPHELASAILERSGVPRSATTVLEEPVDGTESEIAAVAEFVRSQHLHSLLLITARTHSARARWLLRRTMPGEVRVAVRSAAEDEFQPRGWWRSREQTRELVMEYVRWLHTVIPVELGMSAASPGGIHAADPMEIRR